MATGSTRPGIRIETVPNLRDLGGWQTREGGRVRSRLLYRSAGLDRLQGDDEGVFAGLGIRSIYDLRTEEERNGQPDRVPPGTGYVVCDVLKDSQDAAPAQLMKASSDPKLAEEMLGSGKAFLLFERGYRQTLSLPSALAAYRRLFSDLSRDEHRPALFHCTGGKDRTGWAAASILTLLGVPDEVVMHEYFITNDELLPALKPMFDNFESMGGDPELLMEVFGVRKEYLEAALDEMRLRYGTIEGYFTEGLGLDADVLQALTDAFIESDSE
jgi:protein-tyrosine phosphatase